MSRRRKIAIVTGVLLALYAFVGFVVVPRIVESQLVEQLRALTGRTASVAGVSFDPFGFRLSIEGFALPDVVEETGAKRPPVIAFDALSADLRVLSLLIGRVALEEVGLEAPRVRGVIDEQGTLNLAQVLLPTEAEEADEPAQEPAASEGGGVVVDVDTIHIDGGRISLVDRSQSPVFEAAIAPLDLAIDGFTTRAGGRSPYSLSLSVGERTRLDWTGTIGLDPFESEGEITLSDFDLTLPWDFFSDRLRFVLMDGSLEVGSRYAVRMLDGERSDVGQAPSDKTDAGLRFDVTDARIQVRNLDLRDPGEGIEGGAGSAERTVIAVPSLAANDIVLSGTGAGLTDLRVGDVALDGARLVIDREADGRLRLVDLLAWISDEAGDTVAGDADAAEGLSEGLPEGSEEAAEEGNTPEIRVDRVAVRDLGLDLTDRSTATPVEVRVAPLSLTVEGYSNAPDAELAVEFETGLGESGRVGLSGPMKLTPMSTRLALELDAIALGTFQPYLEDVARIDIPSGEIGGRLDLEYADRDAGSPRIAARGRVQLDDLVTIDRRLRRRFVEWSSLRIEGIDFANASALDAAADRVRIEEIALKGAAAHVVVGQDGRTNVDAIFGGTNEAASGEDAANPEVPPSSSDEAPAPQIEIAAIRLDGVGADFDDRTTAPPFALSLDGLEGEIAGLSSADLSRAKVALAGRLDDVAPVRIEGQINPLSGDAYTDIAIDVTGVSLPAFTPYSGRFVGYRIDRGKLGLDLDYKLNARHLEAENTITLRQFAFGDRVDSDEATRLPVGLALAVLRDPKGDIEIPLPIEGNIDDPSFSLGRLLRQTFANLITRVATSPFGAIAGVVGGSGDDLAHVLFGEGSDRLADEERRDLVQVASILAERPALKLEIRGRADPEAELTGLRRERILGEVRLATHRSLSRGERERIGTPEALVLDEEQLYDGLSRLYRQRMGGRLRDLVSAEALPDGRTERRAALAEAGLAALAADVEVEGAEWRALARARAAAVQGAVLATELVPAERVYLVDVEVGPMAEAGRVSTELLLSTN